MLILGADAARGQSPGDTVGWTIDPYQSLGSTGQRIAIDHSGNIHFAWMNVVRSPHLRTIYYNCLSGNQFGWPETGTQVSFQNDDYYAQLSVMRDNRVVIAYCKTTPVNSESLYCAIDSAACQGSFSYYRPPNILSEFYHLVSPQVAVDHSNRIHLVAASNSRGPMPIGYIRSNDTGTTWTEPVSVDTLTTASPVVICSPITDKTAIIYCHPADSTVFRNDIYFVESEDGAVWDFEFGKVNITNYGQNGDSLFAFTDVDAVYDYNDDLHIVWTARWWNDSGGSARVFLYHYETASGSISEITYVDMPPINRCSFGSNALAMDKPSVGVDSANMIYVCYSRFDTTDCSLDNLSNSDIYLQRSSTGGLTWSDPLNVTNSRTPNCGDPGCASDLYPSMAEIVNDYVHIFYVCSRSGKVWEPYTDNPMLYLRFPAAPQAIGESGVFPSSFDLLRNYPNPFNARTTIQYSLKNDAEIALSIYNITGRRVAVLSEGLKQAGIHQAIWDAAGVASGVYFARLEGTGESREIRMTLLK